MVHTVECPRCTSSVTDQDGRYHCARHGEVDPLRRPGAVGYDAFAEVVHRAGTMPLYLPWPLSPGWTVADFGLVGGDDHASATYATTVGSSDLDGPVEVTLVAEDPGVGLGGRCAGVGTLDPGLYAGQGPPSVHLRTSGRTVPMWLVEPEQGELFERTVLAGEAEGRWLWLVLRPASAALLLRDGWVLADVTGLGPEALELPFGGPRPSW